MQISKHITLAEATRSDAASREGLDNTPNATQIENIKLWAEKVFEPLREHISVKRKKDTPIHINSIFRSVAVNAAIKGSATSQHCAGAKSGKFEAAGDIETHYPDFTNKDLFLAIKERGVFDQLIWEFGDDKEPAWVHVSYAASGNRRQILKATKINGETKYLPFS